VSTEETSESQTRSPVLMSDEVVEKSPMGRHLFPEEAQSRQNRSRASDDVNEFPLFPDTKSGQPQILLPQILATIELSSFATLHRSLINPVLRTRLLPEVLKASFSISCRKSSSSGEEGRPQPAKAGKPALPAFRRIDALPGRYRESPADTRPTDLKSRSSFAKGVSCEIYFSSGAHH